MLDEIDRGLIHALHLDGRATFQRIGEVLGVSTQTVSRRYARLRETAGLRVVGLADPARTGTTQWLVRLTTTPPASRQLAEILAQRADTTWVMLTSGGTEIFLIVDAPESGTPELLLHDLPRTSVITGISAHYVLHTYLGGPTAWPGRLTVLDAAQQFALAGRRLDSNAQPDIHAAAQQNSAMAPGSRTAARRPVTAEEESLLAALRSDGRAGLARLADTTGWSQSTVARRISELRADGALYFDVEVDDRGLGVTTRALLWATVAPSQLDRVAKALAQHEELAFLAATTGKSNLIAEALCPDPASLHTYLTQRLGAFDAIHTLETTPVLATVKSTSQPTLAHQPARRR
ncbi:Lrp/AsnC family transcriptional regulator [Nocardia sp. NPDC056100]|uniref:Lrp/AsnC family transcriptional regulator n=1 Tax=Nocardia sp. NPDC056100 TaxID=3345712 RepID=UPI0035D78642